MRKQPLPSRYGRHSLFARACRGLLASGLAATFFAASAAYGQWGNCNAMDNADSTRIFVSSPAFMKSDSKSELEVAFKRYVENRYADAKVDVYCAFWDEVEWARNSMEEDLADWGGKFKVVKTFWRPGR